MMSYPAPVLACRKLDAGDDLLSLHQRFPERYPALLSSASGLVAGHGVDVLFGGLEPVELSELDSVSLAQSPWQDALPFVGGYVVFLPYEYAQTVEPCLHLPMGGASGAQAWRVSVAMILDRRQQRLCVVAQPDQAHWVTRCWQDWDSAQAMRPVALQPLGADWSAAVSEEDPQRFLHGVAACRDYILAGDVFQVNLSRQWQLTLPPAVTPADVYARLRRANPAPFAALLCWDGQAVISSSPERLVRTRAGVVETRPIAGTRRRGADDAADVALKDELTLHPKERAEHVMLLDLERNDLGRVCVPGSVHVDELMTVESYTHVHHIVSNVRGQLRAGVTVSEVLHAVFPGGTITGAPKVRCMEIIAELEQAPRGVYTGSLGYVSLDGQMDLNILIRSFHWQGGAEDQAASLSFRAGAGIVYDSDAQAELEETRHKARGLLRALEGSDC